VTDKTTDPSLDPVKIFIFLLQGLLRAAFCHVFALHSQETLMAFFPHFLTFTGKFVYV
jgi:hypothetical protein